MSDILKLDARLLLAFVAIAEERSVTRAAGRLNMTQQGLSGALARLRDLFSDPLFIRESHGVAPTPRAEALYPKVKVAIERLRDVVEAEDFDPSETQSVIRIAAADYALAAVLPPLFEALRGVAPNLRLAVEPLRIENLLVQMRNGQIDLALTVPEFVPDMPHSMTLFSDRYLCAFRKQHPLAGRALTLESFCSGEHLLVSPNRADFRGPVDEALAQVGYSRKVGVVVPSFHIALSLLAKNDLIAVLPERLLRTEQDGLHIFEPPIEIAPFDIICVWPERLHTDSLTVWFREYLRVRVGDR